MPNAIRRAPRRLPLTLLLCLLLAPLTHAQHNPPNLLFILVDDQRNDTLGCAGHPVIQSPHIDQLAAQGTRFTNAFVQTPICMVSRATIFTGLTSTAHGFLGPLPANLLRETDVDASFPTRLRDAGYRTGFFGKQHVRFAQGNTPALQRMFDVHRVIHLNPYFKPQPDGSTRHTADLIGDHAQTFLTDQPDDQPFCLYLSFNIAHAEDGDHRPGIGHFPWPPAADGLYDDINPAPPRLGDERYFTTLPGFLQDSMARTRWHWRWDTAEKYTANLRAYYRMITGLDHILGRVFDTLADQGLADNTVIIYTADNGYFMGDRGLAGKWSPYEESLRVPLIVYDPRQPAAQRGRVTDAVALNLDLPATLLDLASVSVPDTYQGSSLVPILQGDTPADWRTEFYCEHHFPNASIPKWRGLRDARYTYAIYYEQDPPYEVLFDRDRDPTQFQNLADDPAYATVLYDLRDRTAAYADHYTP